MGLLAQIRTGALERRDPLPVGRYWLDVFDSASWQAWLASAGNAVRVVATEHFTSDPPRDWVLFEVMQPTPWGVATKLGWPTIAAPGVQSSSDTQEGAEPEPGPFEEGGMFASGGQYSWVPWAVGGVVVVAGVFAIASLTRSVRGVVG